VIRSFRDPETARIAAREHSRRYAGIERVALRKLRQLDSATSLRDLQAPPANRLEALKGDRAGQHSIRINDQFRVCFVWRDNDAYEVEIVDYH
jgi:toxin HigB-1